MATKSFASRRLRLIQAKKRSTTQRRGWTATTVEVATFSMNGNEPRKAHDSGPPPSRSWMLAGCASSTRPRPSVSAMTGAVPCPEPQANEARSQPTPHRSNQSDNAAPCGDAALGRAASTWRLQIGLGNLPGSYRHRTLAPFRNGLLEPDLKLVGWSRMVYLRRRTLTPWGHIMPWNETPRKQYSRKTKRCESDLTDAERVLLDPLLPPSCRLGRPRQVDLREVVNGIACMLWTGCSWRALPKDFPAFATVQNHFHAWSRLGSWSMFAPVLRRSSGFGRGVVRTRALPSSIVRACRQSRRAERNAAPMPARRSKAASVFADGAYGGDKLASALKEANCPITVEVIGKPKDTKGFVVMSRRWVVERTFGWLRRCRRLSRDFERSIASSLAWLLLAPSRVLMRRIGP